MKASCGCITSAGAFRQEDYTQAPPFSSFLPGIAGLYGKPLWCYTVNRGQAVACFGTQDKDHAIMSFQSAALHYARIEQEGFRTWVRWPDRGFYEPFRGAIKAPRVLTITPWGLEIEERAEAVGLAFRVAYATVPDDSCAALLRTVVIENISAAPRDIEWLDGFPRLIPYGLDHHAAQNAPFICQGNLTLDGLEEHLPFFRQLDAPSYRHVIPERLAGNFFFGFRSSDRIPLPIVVDGDRVFGEGGSWERPMLFAEGAPLDLADQKRACMMASAFVHGHDSLAPGESLTLHSLCGSAATFGMARAFRERALTPGWVAIKQRQAALEVEKIRHCFFLHSGSRLLNEYLPQTFLDNVLRGGLPITLTAGEKKHHLHVFNRVHGDLERDYNRFQLDAGYFSQGNGHYRDVNQNRRNDVWFHPEVGAGNLHYFFNLLRLDGYNPMECQGVVFRLDEDVDLTSLAERLTGRAGVSIPREALASVLDGEFTPGKLLDLFEEAGCARQDWPTLLECVLARSTACEKASFGTGFWIDHWFYCFDQLERYLALYPEQAEAILLNDDRYSYRDDAYRVLPRAERYLLVGDNRIHQVGMPLADAEKEKLIASRKSHPHQVRTEHGTGAVYTTNLIEKIVCLLLNKVASMAPSGCGIEMEAGHPGWHDSINRLPYQFGSSTSEVFQLLRAVRLVAGLLEPMQVPAQRWPTELVDFLGHIEEAIQRHADDPFAYWQAANMAKETFRADTGRGLSGSMRPVEEGRIRALLPMLEGFLGRAMERVQDPETGLPFTYYLHRPLEWTPQIDETGQSICSPEGYPRVNVHAFEAEALPLFLEGPVHALRLLRDGPEAEQLCRALRDSTLFDKKLNMYLLGGDMKRYGCEVGRIGMWTPGWFENENVFLHMEHKLLLAMFESGQYESLFAALREVMAPFQPVERYGRSPIENTSFIVSSRHPAPERHGRGYLPRSSGTTAEVLDLFLRLCFGNQPFRMEAGGQVLTLSPTLPEWMFTAEEEERSIVLSDGNLRTVRFPANSFSALFLGSTLVTCHNPSRGPGWGPGAVRPKGYRLETCQGESYRVEGPILSNTWAQQVRSGGIKMIEVDLH
jgi:hypothetical protein